MDTSDTIHTEEKNRAAEGKSITGSVARLYRAGSEHSKSMDKLNTAAKQLVEWMLANIPKGVALPEKTMLNYESRSLEIWDFTAFQLNLDSFVPLISAGLSNSRENLLRFAKLIATGYLDQLSQTLEEESGVMASSTSEVEAFLKQS